MNWTERAQRVLTRCEYLAECTEEPGAITRTFLSPPMHEVHARVSRWMQEAALTVTVDGAGNIRGRRGHQPSFCVGSHLDTVPRAGMFDGVLGVMIGVELASDFAIEVVGFSEEEGVRFGRPFIGSRAFLGDLPSDLLALKDASGISVEQAIRDFGLDPSAIEPSNAAGYLEFHIEQGPVLDCQNRALAAVDSIAGQSRLAISFAGQANHAGTTPMHLRRDALAGAAEWIQTVETFARETAGLVATVGSLELIPGATNVIPGLVRASLDVRHASDDNRRIAVESIKAAAHAIAARRSLSVSVDRHLDQSATVLDPHLTQLLEQSLAVCGLPVHRMTSGAGHDAMIVARRIPSAMVFLRSPGGISHHPAESVHLEDVAAALQVGSAFLERLP